MEFGTWNLGGLREDSSSHSKRILCFSRTSAWFGRPTLLHEGSGQPKHVLCTCGVLSTGRGVRNSKMTTIQCAMSYDRNKATKEQRTGHISIYCFGVPDSLIVPFILHTLCSFSADPTTAVLHENGWVETSQEQWSTRFSLVS